MIYKRHENDDVAFAILNIPTWVQDLYYLSTNEPYYRPYRMEDLLKARKQAERVLKILRR